MGIAVIMHTAAAAAAASLQLCPTLCDPTDGSPPGSLVHGSLQARIMKLQYFGHLMQRVNSLEKTLMVGRIEGRRIRG